MLSSAFRADENIDADGSGETSIIPASRHGVPGCDDIRCRRAKNSRLCRAQEPATRECRDEQKNVCGAGVVVVGGLNF